MLKMKNCFVAPAVRIFQHFQNRSLEPCFYFCLDLWAFLLLSCPLIFLSVLHGPRPFPQPGKDHILIHQPLPFPSPPFFPLFFPFPHLSKTRSTSMGVDSLASFSRVSSWRQLLQDCFLAITFGYTFIRNQSCLHV